MKTAVASGDEKNVLPYVVSVDGTVILARDCVLVGMTTERAVELVENHSDGERSTIAAISASATSADHAWWVWQEHRGEE